MRIKSLIGKRFGKLTVVSRLDVRNQCQYWLCHCDCGNFSQVSSGNLSGGVKQCSSCGHRVPRPTLRKRPFEKVYNKLVYECVKRTQISISLSYEEFLEFTTHVKCHYCKESVVWNPQKDAYNLDRKDNNQGYSKANCVVCCIRCNKTKGNRFTYEEFQVMMDALLVFRKNK